MNDVRIDMCTRPEHEPGPYGSRWFCGVRGWGPCNGYSRNEPPRPKPYVADAIAAGADAMTVLNNSDNWERPDQVGGTHYRDLAPHEPFDVIEVWSRGWPGNKMVTYMLGNSLKYIARLGRKGDADKAKEDLDKAIHYLIEARKRL